LNRCTVNARHANSGAKAVPFHQTGNPAHSGG
jgi:hypothetical protein